MRSTTLRSLVPAVALLPACFVVSEDALNAAQERFDGGQVQTGAADTCTSPDIQTIDKTTTGLIVNTSSLQPDTNISCGTTTAPGNDGFFRLQVAAGDFWHFHAAPTMGGMGWDPVIYVLQDCANTTQVCSGRNFSNKCGAGTAPDEHFGFRFPASGTWFLAVDEATPMGGTYNLSAFRTTCGNGTATTDPEVAASQGEHGESCDDGNQIDDGVCDSKCRRYLPNAAGSQEFEVNDDQFWANVVPLQLLPSPVLEFNVSGETIGTCDPDFYFVNVPPTQKLRVTARVSSGGACAGTIPYNLRMLNATANTTLASNTNIGDQVNPCQGIEQQALNPGAYYIFVDHSTQVEGAPVFYHLRFELF